MLPPEPGLPDMTPGERRVVLTQAQAELDACKAQLKAWQEDFKAERGARPSADEMTTDPTAAELLARFRAKTKDVKVLEASLNKDAGSKARI